MKIIWFSLTLFLIKQIFMKRLTRTNGSSGKIEDLQKMRVVLKRALYFITCNGKMMYRTKMDEDYILRNILDPREKLPVDLDITYQQLSLFDTGKGWLEIHE